MKQKKQKKQNSKVAKVSLEKKARSKKTGDKSRADASLTHTEAPKANVKNDKGKIRYELWYYDEYGQGSIVHSDENSDLSTNEIIGVAKRHVTEQNVENALAAGEWEKTWEIYFPEIFINDDCANDVFYAGNRRNGNHYVYVKDDGKWKLRKASSDIQFRFFIGHVSNGKSVKSCYLKNEKGKYVTSLDDALLSQRGVLFIKIIDS